jgi:two-component system, NtrC family, sensor kinase
MATMQEAMIAELQRANVELRQERNAALAREAALAEVLDVINRSPGDLGPVFDAMLENATRLCDAPCGMLWRYDGERYWPAATFGLPSALAAYLGDPENVFISPYLLGIAEGHPFHHVVDLSRAEAYQSGDWKLSRAVVDLGGAPGLFNALYN